MYGYNQYVPLRLEEILSRCTERDIFQIVIQEDIVLNKGALYRAPYRNDENANCYFENYEGKLRFVDFARTGKPALTCFDMIKECFNCSFRESFSVINEKLSLGLGDNNGKAKEIIREHGVVEEKNVKKVFKKNIITYLPRQFNNKDKNFWSKYGITKKNLQDDKIIPIEIYRATSRTGKPFSVRPIDICYAYTEFQDNKVKLYRPHASKDAKWITSCNQNDVGSIIHLPVRVETLLISKAYKDCRVIRNQNIFSIWFQNEGQIPTKEVLIEILSKVDKEVIIWFDNDSTGLSTATFLVEHIKSVIETLELSISVRKIFLPPRLLQENIKDASDLYDKKGEEALKEFLRDNNIIPLV
jgi:hypothetical protein